MKKFLRGGLYLLVLCLLLVAALQYLFDPNKEWKEGLSSYLEQSLDVKAQLGELKLNLFNGPKLSIDGVQLFKSGERATELSLETLDIQLIPNSLLRGRFMVRVSSSKAGVKGNYPLSGVEDVKSALQFLSLERLRGKKEGQHLELESGWANFLVGRLEYILDLDQIDIQLSEQKFSVKNLIFENAGRFKPMPFSFLLGLNFFSSDRKSSIQGEVGAKGEVSWSEGVLSINSKLDLTHAGIYAKDILYKESGKELGAELLAKALPDRVQVESLNFVVKNHRLRFSGGFWSDSQELRFQSKVVSSFMDIGVWQGVFLPLSLHLVTGQLNLNGDLSYEKGLWTYDLGLGVSEGQIFFPGFNFPLSAIRLDGRFNNAGFEIKDFSLGIGKSTVSGSLSRQTEAKRKMLGRLSFSSLDLEDLLLEVSENNKKERWHQILEIHPSLPETHSRYLYSTKSEILDLYPNLMGLGLELDIQGSSFFFSKLTARNFEAKLYTRGRSLVINQGLASAYSGKLGFVGSVDTRTELSSFRFKFANVEIKEVLDSFSHPLAGQLAGKAAGSMNFQLKQTNFADMESNFVINNGEWKLLGSLGVLESKLFYAIRPKEGSQIFRLNSKFEKASISVVQKGGVLVVRNLSFLGQAPGASLEGTMKLFSKNQMDARFNLLANMGNPPKAIRKTSRQAKIPLQISGTVEAPEPNWERLDRQLESWFRRPIPKTPKKKIDLGEKQRILKDDRSKKIINEIGNGK